MPKFYEVVNAEDQVLVLLPAQQRLGMVLVLSAALPVIGFDVLWWGYQWLTSAAMFRQGVSEVSAATLLILEFFALRLLLLELSVTRLAFERTTIEVKKSLFGLRVAQNWYSCYRVREFQVVSSLPSAERIRWTLLTERGQSVLLAADMPDECFVQLVHLLRRKDYAYLRETS